jgi:hypothetical protein
MLSEALDSVYPTYMDFIEGLKRRCGITLMDWRYYHDGKAWLSKGKPLEEQTKLSRFFGFQFGKDFSELYYEQFA